MWKKSLCPHGWEHLLHCLPPIRDSPCAQAGGFVWIVFEYSDGKIRILPSFPYFGCDPVQCLYLGVPFWTFLDDFTNNCTDSPQTRAVFHSFTRLIHSWAAPSLKMSRPMAPNMASWNCAFRSTYTTRTVTYPWMTPTHSPLPARPAGPRFRQGTGPIPARAPGSLAPSNPTLHKPFAIN
jgi:hypothetical protein